VAQQLAERDEFLAEIRDRLEQAQQHYKSYYDKKHRGLQFSVHDRVWLCLLNRPVASLDITRRGRRRHRAWHRAGGEDHCHGEQKGAELAGSHELMLGTEEEWMGALLSASS
jgi:hypothetical protein